MQDETRRDETSGADPWKPNRRDGGGDDSLFLHSSGLIVGMSLSSSSSSSPSPYPTTPSPSSSSFLLNCFVNIDLNDAIWSVVFCSDSVWNSTRHRHSFLLPETLVDSILRLPTAKSLFLAKDGEEIGEEGQEVRQEEPPVRYEEAAQA